MTKTKTKPPHPTSWTWDEWLDARRLTWHFKRDLLRCTVGDDWLIDCMWCELPEPQERSWIVR